jgi:large-conductance mechanosensitive channel
MDKYIEIKNRYLNYINNYIKILLLYIIKVLKNNYEKFINFLIEKNVLHLCVAIILGTQIGRFTELLNNTIFKPILEKINTNVNINNNMYTKNIFGINIKYGELFLGIINLLISLLIIYVIWSFTTFTNFSQLGIILGAIEENLNNE